MGLLNWSVESSRLEQLVRRTESAKALAMRSIEEDIVNAVSISDEEKSLLRAKFLSERNIGSDDEISAWLAERGWDATDLDIEVQRLPALDRFAQQHFGAGVEEIFLRRKSELDTVVYSLLRVQDHGLAQELWIQLSEGEISFPEAASRHSDGPEAATKGVIGPVVLGQLQPELAERLRSLRQGELREPLAAGQWWILLRLEQLTPAKLDDAMRQRLLQEQLNSWLQQRCDAVLRGEPLESLHYDP